MGQFEFVASPVSADDPCGPDLEGQGDFDSAMAWVEGRLPQSYLKFANPQKMAGSSESSELTSGFDLQTELAPLLPLLKRSRDVRLLVLAAKLSILSGDFARFSEIVSGMAALAANHWDELHPRASGGDYALRESHFSLLSDTPTVVMPLQEKPFATMRRLGPVSYRHYLLATKAITPRAKEVAPEEAQLREALVKSDDFADIKTLHAGLSKAAQGLKAIRDVFVAKAGSQSAPDFDKLNAVLEPFIGFLAGIIEEREPAAPAPEEGEGAAADAGGGEADAEGAPQAPPAARPAAIASSEEAAALLAAVDAYFRTREPSNPAALLVRQAQQLVGKSFIEAMQLLNPQLAEKAAIRIGGDIQLVVSAKQMAELAKGGASAAAAQPSREVASRAEASALMEAIEKYYRAAEPASPIPLLLGRARSYSGKDFAALLREIGPANA